MELGALLARGEGAGLLEGARVDGRALGEDEEARLVAVLDEGAQQPVGVSEGRGVGVGVGSGADG